MSSKDDSQHLETGPTKVGEFLGTDAGAGAVHTEATVSTTINASAQDTGAEEEAESVLGGDEESNIEVDVRPLYSPLIIFNIAFFALIEFCTMLSIYSLHQ